MPGPHVEFWFEFASTYSHVAALRIEPVARAAGVAVSWRPFLLGPIFKQQGWNDSPFNVYPNKGAYMWMDVARECRKHGIAFRRPSQFPRNSLLATRIALIEDDSPRIAALTRAIYLANFRDDLDIADPAVLRQVLADREPGEVEALLQRASAPEIKQRLRERGDQAVARGMFGAPTFAVGDELFWGNDRLEDAVAAALRAAP
jgi:2-hydroxychromene-2-carboxylate isomerase